MKKYKTPPRLTRAQERENTNTDMHLTIDKAFDIVPPAYRKPLRKLVEIGAKRQLQFVPPQTVFFVFEGYRFRREKIRVALYELEVLGVIEYSLPRGLRFHLNKDARYEVLFQMKDRGLIEVVPFKGIRILESWGGGA